MCFIASLLASFEAAVGNYADYNRKRQDILRYVDPFGDYYYDDERGRSVSVMDVANDKKAPESATTPLSRCCRKRPGRRFSAIPVSRQSSPNGRGT